MRQLWGKDLLLRGQLKLCCSQHSSTLNIDLSVHIHLCLRGSFWFFPTFLHPCPCLLLWSESQDTILLPTVVNEGNSLKMRNDAESKLSSSSWPKYQYTRAYNRLYGFPWIYFRHSENEATLQGITHLRVFVPKTADQFITQHHHHVVTMSQ